MRLLRLSSMSSAVSLYIAVLFITGCVFSKCLSSCASCDSYAVVIHFFYMEQYFRLTLHETTQARKHVQYSIAGPAEANFC